MSRIMQYYRVIKSSKQSLPSGVGSNEHVDHDTALSQTAVAERDIETGHWT
jgi:hypothetical protein